MKRILTSLAVLSLFSLAVACDKQPGEKAMKQENAANERADEAQQKAQEEVQLTNAKAERDIAVARADFEKARTDYRTSRQHDLAELNKKITDLEVKQKTATGKTRATLDANLPVLRADRDAFATELQRLEGVTVQGWDAAKASLDKQWDALNKTLSATP